SRRLSSLLVFHLLLCSYGVFFCNDTATSEIYTLSLHDALPICLPHGGWRGWSPATAGGVAVAVVLSRRFTSPAAIMAPAVATYRSEEHTSELQSRENLVCRLLLEKKKKKKRTL